MIPNECQKIDFLTIGDVSDPMVTYARAMIQLSPPHAPKRKSGSSREREFGARAETPLPARSTLKNEGVTSKIRFRTIYGGSGYVVRPSWDLKKQFLRSFEAFFGHFRYYPRVP